VRGWGGATAVMKILRNGKKQKMASDVVVVEKNATRKTNKRKKLAVHSYRLHDYLRRYRYRYFEFYRFIEL
jgi:hypothetical protein